MVKREFETMNIEELLSQVELLLKYIKFRLKRDKNIMKNK